MTIAMDASTAARQFGGVSEYTYQLLRAWGALPPKHEFSLATIGWNQEIFTDGLPDLPAQFHRYSVKLPQRLVDWLWRSVGWPKITSFLPPHDVFFSPHFLVPPGNYKKLVVSVLDVLFLDHPEWFLAHDARNFTRAVTAACRQADHLLTISEASKSAIIAHGLASPEKVTVTPLAAHPIAFSPAEIAAVRRQAGLPESYLLYVGTLEPRKNIIRLLAAYKTARAAGVTEPLVLLGRRGWIGEEFDRALAQFKPGEVRVLGSVSRVDRDAILFGAKLLVFPSLGEGFGLPALEGMAAGVPVITSNVSSLPEVAGSAALLIDPLDTEALAQAMVRVASDQRLRTKLIQAGTARAKHFSWEKTARQTLAILEQVGEQ